VGLRAVEFESDKKSGFIKQIRLMFERIRGANLKKFISDESSPLK
jgi:hypothetical protein